ncbi:hypothetical protein F0T03_13505 [Yersinia canariae]|uniref:Uncharacterized protein n=1 Tax=Yersinia canariae TaxID=2607663 RepID=A0A857F0Q1_9GAMM|nr:hypothetical protein [Yersinia canariae]QHB33078.1 hypothetical protein F0T03_13505 [Yersinia canariae]
MRTLQFLVVGFVLAGLCRLLVRLFIPVYPPASSTFSLLFFALWFGLTSANMVFGITRAGYSFTEELPIFLLILLPPVIVTFWLAGK